MSVDRCNEWCNAGYLGIAPHRTTRFLENGLETLLGREDLSHVWQAHSHPIACEAEIPGLMSCVAGQFQEQNAGSETGGSPSPLS
ncbi:MAG: hypothetical protein OXG56_01100 [Gammaproteobacteria bacterium]|nr:hypothetical protein [Gammaproteobacteria bacterium]